ncbi:MAG TPA: hypothetical protein PKA20_21780 [Burkholderiaceae bacterium]|nr:hypothetical protein [Burkholderiaceae bacterium]
MKKFTADGDVEDRQRDALREETGGDGAAHDAQADQADRIRCR